MNVACWNLHERILGEDGWTGSSRSTARRWCSSTLGLRRQQAVAAVEVHQAAAAGASERLAGAGTALRGVPRGPARLVSGPDRDGLASRPYRRAPARRPAASPGSTPAAGSARCCGTSASPGENRWRRPAGPPRRGTAGLAARARRPTRRRAGCPGCFGPRGTAGPTCGAYPDPHGLSRQAPYWPGPPRPAPAEEGMPADLEALVAASSAAAPAHRRRCQRRGAAHRGRPPATSDGVWSRL